MPLLIAPAGDWPALKTAVAEGADAVYFGVKGLNMRNLAGNFDLLEIKKVTAYTHEHGRKAYLTLNTVILPQDLPKAKKILITAKAAKVDAVICWDMAVVNMCKQFGLPVHLSTQASVANFEAVKFYAALGVKRIVLARECSLKDVCEIIKNIHKEKLDCDIELFVHGAMCVSISGRCFLSQFTFNKSANKGECLQPCRREYLIKDVENEAEYIVGKDYLLSPKDLCAIEFVDKLIDAGVGAFKIEGRRRAPEYVKVAVVSYRKAIDAYAAGKLDARLKAGLKSDLAKVYNRGFSTGFYLGAPADWKSTRLEGEYEKVFLGDITKFYKKISVAEIVVRSHLLHVGDRILVTGKHTPAAFADCLEIEQEHKKIPFAGPGQKVAVKLPFEAKRGDKAFLWRKKE